jgi:RNA-directed DNA polymerase
MAYNTRPTIERHVSSTRSPQSRDTKTKWRDTHTRNSYSHRPTHSTSDSPSTHAQAIEQARRYVEEGYEIVVDLDITKFFDNVNHDRLMAKLATRIEDKRVLKLIRRYLQTGGIQEEDSVLGTPQGSPLSPLLANIVLDEFDKELEARNHRFVRYADDCNIYVRSKRAGERVMENVDRFLRSKLRLEINKEKSAVDKPIKRSFLGFSVYKRDGAGRICIPKKTMNRFRKRIKELTQRRRTNLSMESRIEKITPIMRGWFNYFGIAATERGMQDTDRYARRRLRMCQWKQWKRIKTKYKELKHLGIQGNKAYEYANTRKGYWHVSNSWILAKSLTNRYFDEKGLFSLQQALKLKQTTGL